MTIRFPREGKVNAIWDFGSISLQSLTRPPALITSPRELLGMTMRTVGHHVMHVLRFVTMCYSGPTVDTFVDVLMRSYPSEG